MAMEELDQLAEKHTGDEFYEKIEAPKFVDFTVPDHYRPDDRYWFCLRVGCDQKHEEEMDSEAVYKNFVLRVMAARSPNIKIRKMLTRKPSALKCPLTAPAKASKSKVSRLADLSSIVRKLDVAEDIAKVPLKNVAETPKPSLKKPSSSAKAFTTPRNRKPVTSKDKFMSVRVSKPTSIAIALPKTNTVAKALVFRSPRKKTVRVKMSLELKTPVGKLCTAMSKLEIASGRKKKVAELKTPVGKLCRDMSNLEIASGKKQQFRGRVVKSRVYDSLHSRTPTIKETKLTTNIESKKAENDSVQNDSSNMEVEQRSRKISFEPCSVSDGSKNDDQVLKDRDLKEESVKFNEDKEKEPRLDVKIEEGANIDDQVSKDRDLEEERAKLEEDKENEARLDVKTEEVKLNGRTTIRKKIKNDDKENTVPSEEPENTVAIEHGKEENVSASDENREPSVHSKIKIKNNQRADEVNHVTKKPLKKSSIVTPGPQEAKYRKPKPTNPKPFRLRTDERSLLKEATLEKKLVMPFREITTLMKPVLKSSLRKNHSSGQKNENCQERSESSVGKAEPENPKVKMASKKKCLLSTKEHSRIEGTSSEKNSDRTKPSTTPQGTESDRRKTAKFGVIKEVSSSSAPRGKRRVTVPKEPNFHAIHVPKSCSRKSVV